MTCFTDFVRVMPNLNTSKIMKESVVIIAGNPMINLDRNGNLISLDVQPWAIQMALERAKEIQATSVSTLVRVCTLLDQRYSRKLFLKRGVDRKGSDVFLSDLREVLRRPFDECVKEGGGRLQDVAIMWESSVRRDMNEEMREGRIKPNLLNHFGAFIENRDGEGKDKLKLNCTAIAYSFFERAVRGGYNLEAYFQLGDRTKPHFFIKAALALPDAKISIHYCFKNAEGELRCTGRK
jgi:hypothetical protein